MNTVRTLINVGIVGASLFALTTANAESLRQKELTCNGTVTWGKKTFSDQVVLGVSNDEVKVSGGAGISTFEGGLPYKICFEDKDEMGFEYTAELQCGKGSTRRGYLHKVGGNLRLTRSDRGEPFVGEYKCKPAQRVLN